MNVMEAFLAEIQPFSPGTKITMGVHQCRPQRANSHVLEEIEKNLRRMKPRLELAGPAGIVEACRQPSGPHEGATMEPRRAQVLSQRSTLV